MSKYCKWTGVRIFTNRELPLAHLGRSITFSSGPPYRRQVSVYGPRVLSCRGCGTQCVPTKLRVKG